MPKVTITARTQGAAEVARAFANLPRQARDELDEAKTDLSERLARIVRAAGRADTAQTARGLGGPANTVRATGGTTPAVRAGPHPLLFATEFGMDRRSGWYAAPRYLGSRRRQFRPHRGASSYWFFRTVDANQPMIDVAWSQACDAIVRRWSA